MMLTVRLVFAVWLFCFTFADVFDDDNWRYVMQTMLDLMSFIVIYQYHFYLFRGIFSYCPHYCVYFVYFAPFRHSALVNVYCDVGCQLRWSFIAVVLDCGSLYP